MTVKLALLAAALFAAELLPKLLHAGWLTMLTIAGVAAGVAGAGYLFRLIRRGWRNARAIAKLVVEIILSLPERVDKIEARLTDGEAHFARQDVRQDRMDKALDVLADTARYRVDDAISGDKRSPVDRRQRPAA